MQDNSLQKDLRKLVDEKYKEKLQTKQIYSGLKDPFLDHFFHSSNKKHDLKLMLKNIKYDMKHFSGFPRSKSKQVIKNIKELVVKKPKAKTSKRPFLYSSVNYEYNIETERLHIQPVSHTELQKYMQNLKRRIFTNQVRSYPIKNLNKKQRYNSEKNLNSNRQISLPPLRNSGGSQSIRRY